jgi:hypothetical protein
VWSGVAWWHYRPAGMHVNRLVAKLLHSFLRLMNWPGRLVVPLPGAVHEHHASHSQHMLASKPGCWFCT